MGVAPKRCIIAHRDRGTGGFLGPPSAKGNTMSKFEGLGLSTDTPSKMILVHPVTRQPLRDEDGNEGYIDLYSSDSDVARKYDREVTRRRLNQRGQIRLSPEELEAEGLDKLAALTAGWNLVALNGKKLDVPCNTQNARELYSIPSMTWIRDQVNEFAVDRANFAKASSSD